MSELTWQDHLKQADAHKALGHKEIYLNEKSIEALPWHLTTKVEPGGSHRLEMATSVWFHGRDPKSGLDFRWSFDLEPHSANGKSHYEVDVQGCRTVMGLLPSSARQAFCDYLNDAAAKVQANADKYEETARREYGTVQVLRRIASNNLEASK